MAEQLSLFPPEPAPERYLNDGRSPSARARHVYLPSFLSPDEQDEFIRRIDENEGAWLTDLSRRVQQYGVRLPSAGNHLGHAHRTAARLVAGLGTAAL